MRWRDATRTALRDLSGTRSNEIRDHEQRSSADGHLGAELHACGIGCQHPRRKLERSSRWIPDRYSALATWRGEHCQLLPAVRVKRVMNYDMGRDGIATLYC